MISVIIGGDVCPLGRNLPYFKQGNAKSIFNDLLEEFENADLSIINLECPLIEKWTPIVKNGPVLGAESACINCFKKAKIDVLNLANNHIMDHGPQGLKNTLRICSEAEISTVGAGKNFEEARRVLIRKSDKIRIGILSVAEHEFSIATKNSWGANPLDLIDFVRNVENQKQDFDYLVVLLHGGNEHYPYPSPRLKDTCRFMVEMGANAVIVQHTHCPGCYEEYKNGHIVYGQGNLIFDKPNGANSFYQGFLVKLLITEKLNSTMEIVPSVQSKSHPGARKMEKKEEQLFLESLKKRSMRIADNGFVRAEWLEFCKNRKESYLSKLLGYNRFFSKLNKKGLLLKYFYGDRALTRIQNVVCCEAHREVIETIFKNRLA